MPIVLRGRWAATVLLATCALAPFGAGAQSFAAKPGAWEMTTTMSGGTIPPEILAKMPPERRAAAEKMMAERAGTGAASGNVRRSCVKQEDLDRDSFARSPERTCTTKTVSRSSNKLVLETSCAGPPVTTGTMTFEAKTPESVVGSIDQQRADGTRLHIGLVGRWIGASCDGIPPRGPN